MHTGPENIQVGVHPWTGARVTTALEDGRGRLSNVKRNLGRSTVVQHLCMACQISYLMIHLSSESYGVKEENDRDQYSIRSIVEEFVQHTARKAN